MANEIQKCPMCSTKLKMMNGRMTCKECGYYIRNDAAVPYSTNTQNTVNQTSYTTSRPSTTYVSGNTGNTNSAGSSGNGLRIAVTGIIIVAIGLIVGAIYVGIQFGSYIMEDGNYAYESIAGSSSSTRDKDNSRSNSRTADYRPQSGFFQELAESIFDKDFDDISREELDSITVISLNEDQDTLYYETSYGDSYYLTVAHTNNMDLADLKCFNGLEWLYLPGENLHRGDLDGLENLWGLFCGNSLNEVYNIVPYPENIFELGVEGSGLESSLDGVENFTGLAYLTVHYSFLEDISALSQLPNLRGLYLENCDRLSEYGVLMNLPNLEELRIQSEQLKTIDFVKVMPNLTYLSIEDTKTPNIDALSSCPNLTYLYLEDNYQVDDYSVIENLTELKNLTIYHSSYIDDIMPSLEGLTQLEQLALSRMEYDALYSLPDAANLTQLTLKDCNGIDLEPLTGMPQLTTLSLIDCYMYASPYLEPLTRTSLVTLNLKDSMTYEHCFEEVFGIPTLQYLYLDQFRGAIDFDKLPYNESLLELSMNGIRICTPDDEYTNQNLSDHYDMFSHFPNLVWLYLAETNIDSIEFVEYLPNLHQLDITNNNVTSLKPLEALDEFWLVRCGYNTILEDVSEDSEITVDKNSYYSPYH